MKPRLIIHNSTSLDGRLTGFEIDMERHYGLAASFGNDVHLAGSETILAQESMLPEDDHTAFDPPKVSYDDRRAILVVPDSRGRIKRWHGLRVSGFWKDVVALVSASTPGAYLEFLRERHVRYLVKGDDRVDLAASLVILADELGTKTVMQDSGGILNGVMLEAGLVDEVSLLVHPVIAGEDQVPLFRLTGSSAPPRLEMVRHETVSDGLLWIRCAVLYPGG
jgi:2,5-diamino-6-(ribosylamino)-4(3H)-pyrimidinone 5'-phosphate reductase